MELRARIRPLPRRAAFLAALVALVASALAGAVAPDAHAKKKSKKKAPVITRVAPLDVAVGETLTIRGRNFRTGRNKNTVVFKRAGARAVFVKAGHGTRKMLRVTVPDTVQRYFKMVGGAPVPTKFRLRVLAAKFGKKFTSLKRSPVLSGPRPPVPVVPDDQGDCDNDGVRNLDDTDDDNDLLLDDNEKAIGTDPCKLDTDGDKVEDGYEYRSARDLNDDEFQQPNNFLAYPHKMPYPNPGFADGDTDYDGDSLTLKEEYDLWVYTHSVTKTDPRSLDALSYSDGEQYTRSARTAGGTHDGRRKPTLAADGYDKHVQFVGWATQAGYRTVMLAQPGPWWYQEVRIAPYGLFDMNRDGETAAEVKYFDLRPDGWLSDDERDEDADGLSNYDETHGRMLPEYWKGCYPSEKPFHVPYAGTSHVVADTDGDGVLDGADDQDHDDVPNVMELSRIAASNPLADDRKDGRDCVPRDGLTKEEHPAAFGRVNPFNPCLPNRHSRTCPVYFDANTGAPFDDSPNWHALN